MSFRLGKIQNIPLTIHWSFSLLLVGIVSVVSITQDIETGMLYGIGTIALFASVVIHEFMHSYVASRFGYDTEEIVLYPLGGMSKIEEIPTEPKQEFLIAFFGPVTNFVIAGLVFLGLKVLGPFNFTFLGRSFGSLVGYYITLNIALGVFNLAVPAIPMDGGRLLRSILATQMNFQDATMTAVRISKILAVIMGIIGFVANPWLLFIAIFIYIASSSEMEQSLTKFVLEDVTLSQVPLDEVATVSPDHTVSGLLDRMLDLGKTGFLVTSDGKNKGFVSLKHIRKLEDTNYENLTVKEIFDPNIVTLERSSSAKQAFQLFQESPLDRIYITEHGEIQGVLTPNLLLKYIKIKALSMDNEQNKVVVENINDTAITS